MTRYKIILNPTSGNGRGKRSLSIIKELFAKYQLTYDLAFSERHGHAIDLTISAVNEGYDVIVAAGGDGTVNEVINGLMQAKTHGESTASLGVLCIGRGNDFAGGVGIPNKLEPAVQVIAENRFRKIDIGQVFGGIYLNGRYFGNCVGVGFDAMGTIQVAKLPRLGGLLSYLIAIIKTIYIYYKAPLVHIEWDGKHIHQNSLLVSIMNGTRLGGGFLMAPKADPADGLLDLCIVSDVSKGRIFSLIPHFLRGTQMTQPEVKMDVGKRISIKAIDGALPVQTDGEIICIDGEFIDVIVHPLQINVISKYPQID